MEWWEALDLPFGKTLVAIGPQLGIRVKVPANLAGVELASTLFHGHARDAMLLALSLNDKAAFMGLPAPFNRVGPWLDL